MTDATDRGGARRSGPRTDDECGSRAAGSDGFDVTLEWTDGRTETIVVAPDETVLEAAESDDIVLPYGCRYGACATCTGEVRTGTVRHRDPPHGLKDRHLEAGYVLLCIAVPETDCRIRVGSSVQADLFTDPWK